MPSTELATAPPVAQPPAVALPPERALNSTQLKNLQAILDGDFADLRERVSYEIEQQRSRKHQEVEAKFDDRKKVDAARKKLATAEQRAREILQKAVDQMEASGLSLDVANKINAIAVSVTTVGLHVAGKKEALNAVNSAAQRLQATAQQVVNRRHREAQRKVLLAGITSHTASDLVNGMPKATDIMGEVEAQVALNNEDDLQVLGLA